GASWTAPAKRSDDGAFERTRVAAFPTRLVRAKAVSPLRSATALQNAGAPMRAPHSFPGLIELSGGLGEEAAEPGRFREVQQAVAQIIQRQPRGRETLRQAVIHGDEFVPTRQLMVPRRPETAGTDALVVAQVRRAPQLCAVLDTVAEHAAE